MCQADPPAFNLSDRVGWVVCQGGGAGMVMPKRLYLTKDGGETWSLISKHDFGIETPIPEVGLAPSAIAMSIVFRDERRGWMIVGSAGTGVYRTSDGGYSWKPVEEFGNDIGTGTVIVFFEETAVVVKTARGSWITFDDGNRWQRLP